MASSHEAGLRHLIEHIQDAVVAFELVDQQPIVRDVNNSFEEVFGYGHDEILDEDLNDFIVPRWLDQEASTLDERTAEGEINYREVRRQTNDGLREFLYRGIPYDGPGIDGYALYTDLTDVSRKEKQLCVFNRVLRHNLRNEVTVIQGAVDQLQSDPDADVTDQFTAMAAASVDRLVTLSDEAGRISHILDLSPGEQPEVDIVPVVLGLVAEFEKRYPAARIETDLPDTLRIAATSDLRTALSALLENAIEHNPDDHPVVHLHTTSVVEEQWVDVVTDDNGPLIPEEERAVVSDEAAITPHRHGSGLGLWLAKWTIEQFGGELRFEESSLGGNRVQLRLRQA